METDKKQFFHAMFEFVNVLCSWFAILNNKMTSLLSYRHNNI